MTISRARTAALEIHAFLGAQDRELQDRRAQENTIQLSKLRIHALEAELAQVRAELAQMRQEARGEA